MKPLLSHADIDSIVAGFDPILTGADAPPETRPVTFWLPIEYKEKYDRLQAASKRTFTYDLKELLMKAIDKAKIES